MRLVTPTRSLIHDSAVAITDALRRRSILTTIAVLVCAAASFHTANRLRPFVDDVTEATSGGDDWFTYKQNALDILDHGWTMPGIPDAYYQPSGFLYNYFVAGVFAIAGRVPAYVYVAQGALLAVATVLYYLIGRRTLAPELALLFPVAVGFLLYRTVYQDLVIRLLSENLVIPLIPAAVLMFLDATKRGTLSRFAATGLMVGIVVLTRPHMQAITFFLGVLAWWYGSAAEPRRSLGATALVVASLCVLSVIAVRNGAVTGHFTLVSRFHATLLPALSQYGGVIGVLQLFVKRALYCAGILVGGMMMSGTDITVSKWLLAPTVLALIGVGRCLRDRHLALIDAVAMAWLLAAYIPFIVLPLLGGYGMRFQWPTAPLLVLLALRGIDPFLTIDSVRTQPRIAPA